MSINTEVAFMAGVFSLIGSTIGSLIAPWVSWDIEQRREKRKYRYSLVQQWREVIKKDFKEFDEQKFTDSVIYASLRPHLRQETIDSIEGKCTTVILGRGGNVIKSLVLDDISLIEEEWRLI
ncbi:hypothetical protein [Synechococcus elongatus]|uniref:Uncharacterized protein n=1 Tax=Synechococcus elongatus PCC 11802 TaxID=2283154 RepID=A0AAT9JNF9_SYNEL|nr:hypothetical protein [Synechococcus elongatus]QFZ92531.1 hypothetical protein EKO22_09420 [Synechococcus elongatus PCC 11802]